MMASSSSSSDLSNADHPHPHHRLLPQAADDQLPCPWPSSSSSMPHLHAANIELGGQWSHPALMQLEQLSSDELEALLHSAQYYHHHSQQQLLLGAAPAVLVPHGQLSSSLLMMQDQLGFQWTSCCSAALTVTDTSQQQDHALLKEEEEEEIDNRMMMMRTSAPATIVDVDAYSDDSAAAVFPGVNVSLLSAASDDGSGGDAFEMSSSSSPARLCRSHDVSSAVLVHNGVPPLLRLREQYGGGGGPPRAEALSSIVHSYSCKMGSAASDDLVSENNNGDAPHMNGDEQQMMQIQVATSKTTKKQPRIDSNTTIVPSFKVRKEKLGDRIAALQQLVSPFGKTDTASVLMEAIGYIKFLQDQVETLSSPYMQRSSRNKKPRTTTTTQQQQRPAGRPAAAAAAASNGGDHSKQQQQLQIMQQVDLRSRGLCLVPLSCTSYVTNENAAVWPPPNFRGN